MMINEILTRAAEVLERSVTLENQTLAAELRRFDNAQRETLARVEADRDTAIAKMQNIRKERDAINKELGDTEFNLCIAQQQLAEAVGLLRKLAVNYGGPSAPNVVRRTEDFLARHAQAEQQEALSDAELMEVAMFVGSGNKAARRASAIGAAELPDHLAPNQEAQGAQAGDERTAFEDEFDSRGFALDRLPSGVYLVPAVRFGWDGWQARAALATQPAEWVDPVALHPAENLYNQGFADGVAEAKRLNAVRGAEHDQ